MPVRKRNSLPEVVFQGEGDFKAVVKNAKKVLTELKKEKALVTRAGTAAGGLIGARFGNKALGQKIARGALKVSGFGDYAIHGNSLMVGPRPSVDGPVIPKFDTSGVRGVRITECEYLGEVTANGLLVSGSTQFSNTTYIINPAETRTFPWLSRIAPLYDQWEPHGIIFQYRPTSSAFNGSSQALGAVIMATDYDSADPAYVSKVEMENSDYACSTSSFQGLLHGIECDPAERPTRLLYTGSAVGTSTVENFHNLGKFQIATQGMSVAGVTLGELWVSYDITFYKKQINNSGASLPYAEFESETDLAPGDNWSKFMNQSLQTDQNINATWNPASPNSQLLFPLGVGTRWIVIVSFVAGSSFPAVNIGVIDIASSVGMSIVGDAQGTASTGATDWERLVVQITVTGPNPVLAFATTTRAIVGRRLIQILQVNSGYDILGDGSG